MELLKELEKSGKRLEDIAEKLNKNTLELVNSELKINLLKAKLVSSAGIASLPNQVMRDAEIENKLQTDDLYASDYRSFQELKTANKVLYTQWVLAQELNKNIRAMLMSGIESKL